MVENNKVGSNGLPSLKNKDIGVSRVISLG
jgi:hypothetical protein